MMAAPLRPIVFALIMAIMGFYPATAKDASSPPPPLAIYDPNPGPYFIFPDENGEIVSNQREFVDHIVSAWSGPSLGAFSICYARAGDEEIDWGLVKKSLDSVSVSLKDAGAKSVVIPPSEICQQHTTGSVGEKSLVQITGVISGR
ncbi:MAG: hypothetical protein CL574_11625 [Altererythrobacter sp.]|nr:hypothetical protein [Altererythrobacter sp.]|tara:strand:+ start:387 stop:824 length:438 start_codon:yes stop_codon:yes gene_type:complete